MMARQPRQQQQQQQQQVLRGLRGWARPPLWLLVAAAAVAAMLLPVVAQASDPCKADGDCSNAGVCDAASGGCICPTGYGGYKCEYTCSKTCSPGFSCFVTGGGISSSITKVHIARRRDAGVPGPAPSSAVVETCQCVTAACQNPQPEDGQTSSNTTTTSSSSTSSVTKLMQVLVVVAIAVPTVAVLVWIIVRRARAGRRSVLLHHPKMMFDRASMCELALPKNLQSPPPSPPRLNMTGRDALRGILARAIQTCKKDYAAVFQEQAQVSPSHPPLSPGKVLPLLMGNDIYGSPSQQQQQQQQKRGRVATLKPAPVVFHPQEEIKLLSHFMALEVPRNAIKPVGVLESGRFGLCFHGELETTSQLTAQLQLQQQQQYGSNPLGSKGAARRPVVVMMLNTSEEQERAMLTEALLMPYLRHDNIVRLLAVSLQQAPFYLVYESLGGGDLRSFLRACNPRLPAPRENLSKLDMVSVAAKIAAALVFLETKGIVHGDVAAVNVQVGTDIRTVKLAGVGIARHLCNPANQVVFAGCDTRETMKHMAPEVAQSGVSTHYGDIWSFGVFMYELYSFGEEPYAGKSGQQVLELVQKGVRLPQPSFCPVEIYSMMQQLWRPYSSDRPDFITLFSDLKRMERAGQSVCYPSSAALGSPIPIDF